MGDIVFTGHGANVVGSLGSGSLVQDMPVAWANYDELNESTKGCEREVVDEFDAMLTAGTWEFWIKQLVGGEYQDGGIFNKALSWSAQLNAGAAYGYKFNFRGKKSTVEYTIEVPQECVIPRGAAVHCCATYDGTTTKMYLNGSLVSSSTALSGVMDDSTSYLYFPKQGASLPQGALWDGRLWSRALPQSEIQYNFANRPTATGGLYDNTGLLGWWPQNGDADDISGNGYDLTPGAGVQYSAVGYNLKQIGSGSVSGTATVSGGTWNLRDSSYVVLDGTAGDEIPTADTGDFEFTERLSIMAWIRPNNTAGYNGIFSNCDDYNAGRNGYTFTVRSGKLAWLFADASSYSENTGVGTINTDEWQHVGMTWDGSEVNTYINGVLIDTSSMTKTPTYAAGDVAMIGQVDNQGSAFAFDGALFDVRVMGYDMCAEEVAALYGGWADPAAYGWWLGIGAGPGPGAETQVTDSTHIPDMGTSNTDATLPSNLWVNPTFATEDHVIIGTYPNTLNPINLPTISAPRGTWNFCHNVSANEATLRNYGNFIHNSGAFSPGNETHSNNGGSRFTTKFYDVIRDQSGQFSFQGCIAWDSGVNLTAAVSTSTQTEWVVDNAAIFTAGDYIVMTEESATAEVIRIASIASNTLTVERGQWGLAPSTYLSAASLYYKPSNNVEGSLISTAGETRLWGAVNDQPTALVFGTPTAAGTVSSSTAKGLQLGSSGGGKSTGSCAGLVGVSTLNPVELLGTPPQVDWQPTSGSANTYIFYGNTTTAVSNDFDAYVSVNTNLKLVGDCAFKDVTIGTDDTFDASDQRVSFSDNFISNGTAIFTDALIYNSKDWKPYETTAGGVYYGNTTLVHAGGDFKPFNSEYIAGRTQSGSLNVACVGTIATAPYNSWSCPGINGDQVDGNGDSYGIDKLMVLDAVFNSAGVVGQASGATALIAPLGDVSIANGATLSGNTYNINLGSDFNMAGGFIGVGALDLNGTDEQVEITRDTSFHFTTGFTLESWFKPTGSRVGQMNLICKESGYWLLTMKDNKPFARFYDGSANVDVEGDDDIDDVKWTHLACAYDKTSFKLFVDGKLVGETLHTVDVDIGENQEVFLGSEGDGSYLGGSMARASIWNTALTESELRAMMFQDWATMAGADVIDDSKCVGWYEFSDDQGATSISDMSGSGNTGTLSTTDAWAGPGTFDYNTSTLVFDNDGGTSNLYGHQDGTGTELYSLTVVSGTTLETYCRNNDFGINAGATLINSGTLNSNRNWAYKSANLPILGAGSDLRVGNKIFYYAAGGICSGAATTYHTFRPTAGSIVWMQGDFTATTMLPQASSITHFNGYKGTTGQLSFYDKAHIVLEPGSGLNFTSTSGFNRLYGGAKDYTFTASGEAAVICATDVAGTAEPNYIEVADNAALVVPVGAVTMTAWVKPDSAALATGTSYMQPIGKINAYRMFINGQGGAQPKGELSVQLQDVGNLTGPSTVSGNVWTHLAATYDGSNIRIYYNGIEVTSSAATGDIYQADPRDLWIGKFATPNRYFPGSIADARLYSTGLTSGNCLTLASINPATNVSGTYADPDNDFGALGWWKCGATASGTLDATNYGESGSAIDGTISGSAKSGFVTVTGSAGFGPMTNICSGMALTNTYVSGMQDLLVGGIDAGVDGTLEAYTSQILTTKGTVVLD